PARGSSCGRPRDPARVLRLSRRKVVRPCRLHSNAQSMPGCTVVTHNRGLPSGSRQLIIQGYRSHRLRASRNGLEGGGGYVGIPVGAVWIGRGKGPQSFERALEVAPQLERIETAIEGLESGAGRGRQDLQRTQPLVGRLGAIVVAAGARARARLAHELLDR